SGVATILEIARLWQAQDFRPARSVLFAAWDGEEQGLLGSQHYVENPIFPLTRTVAMLNLDMVGTGDVLQIDGQGPVAAQLEAGAGVYGITHTLAFMGRSDHVSFYGAEVPAAMLIYWPDVFYHTPNDEVSVIEPDKLKAAGVLSAHTLAALAQGHVELERAVERLQATIGTGDREAFLEGLDSTDPYLHATQAAWFDNLWSRELTNGRRLSAVTVEPSQMRIGDGEASVTLQLTYRWANTTQHDPSVSYDVRFVQRDDTWAFAGYDLDILAGDVVTVGRFASTALGTGPDVPLEASRLLTSTQHTYLTLAADLGLEPITTTRVIYYPDAATMRAIARPAAPPLSPPSQGGDGGGWLVSSAEVAEIAWGQPITPALVNLALNQMGLPPDEGAWLREGLVLHYDAGAVRELLPALVATDVLTPLLDLPILSDLPDQEAQALRGYAWMATEYLLDRHTTAGLRGLCAAWGRSGDGRSAFQEALSLSPDRFEAAWRSNRLTPLRADAEDIQATIAARAQAVIAGSEADFLSTVTLTDPVLRTEERNWFADRADLTVVTYTVTAELAGWSPERNEATVALSVNSVITGEPPSQASYDARFVREGDRWLYAGLAWNE
ncbi:MAG: M28 family peptidase, partial [Chloroflexi bacterium]|nr:M28 family peptidase [Chloroflexota bacterium]